MEKVIDTNTAPMIEKIIRFEDDDNIIFCAPPRIAAVDGKVTIVDLGICNMWCNTCNRSTVHESSKDGFVCTEC